MPISDAKKKADKKWHDKAYEKVQFAVPKGYNEKIQKQADKKGLSKAGYMKKLIDDDIAKDGGQDE